MSLFGPVTNVDLRIWQLSSAHLLRELMDRAHAEELPPVAWTVPVLGGLVGRKDHAASVGAGPSSVSGRW